MEEACRDDLANMLSHAQLIVENDAEISNILHGSHFNACNIDTGICRSVELLKLKPGSKPIEFRLFWIKLESSRHAPRLNVQYTPFDVISAGVDISHGRTCTKLIVISICVVVDVSYRYDILNILCVTDESNWSSHQSLRNTCIQPEISKAIGQMCMTLSYKIKRLRYVYYFNIFDIPGVENVRIDTKIMSV